MDDISLALNPPRFVKSRRTPIRLPRTPSNVWPRASINGRAPVILDSPRADSRVVDLAYPRVDAPDAAVQCPIDTTFGTATHLMPPMTPALAIDDGVITFAGRRAYGFGILIDHGNGLASYYANLQAIVAIRTDLYTPGAQHVRAGESIGYVGAPAVDAFRHLHFELWERDRDGRFVPIDPRPHLATWRVLARYDSFTPAPPTGRPEAM